MSDALTEKAYEGARGRYAALGVNTDAVLERLEAVLGLAPSLDVEWVGSLARGSGAAPPPRCVPGGTRLMDAIDVALAKPGTVTVELMLRERPMVVMGRVHPLTAMLARRALAIPWLSMQ